MAHIALYRKWRSQSFAEMVGQSHIVRTLQNSLREGRLSHAYLFSGPRGTGKTSAAKILAKAVNCERGPREEPCNECDTCRRITEGSVIDVLEIDAASNRGVDEIRDLRDKVKYSPTEVRRKVYIIDEVHMLTTEAFNALLKTLEEPPEHVMFILATTEPHRLPATVISRCQRFEFRRVSPDEQTAHLEKVCEEEGITAEREALQYIAKLSEGGMRDAISLLDQIASFSEEAVTYEVAVSLTGGITSERFKLIAEAVLERDIGACLELVEKMLREGKSADKCLESLLHYFRDLLMILMVPDSAAVTDRILDVEEYRKIASGFQLDELFHIIEVLNHFQTEMKYSGQPQTIFEVALMKICNPSVSSGSRGASERRGDHASAEQHTAGVSQGEQGEIAELRRKLAELELQVSKLMQGAEADSQVHDKPGSSPTPRNGSLTRGTSGGSGSSGKKVKLDGFMAARESDSLKQVLLKWSQVLAQVKVKKITVHAWLVDGEPVSYDSDAVLLAFKSAMHRETTEKQANKQLIEQVMSDTFGHPTRLVTVMMKDWKDAESGAEEASKPEILQLEHESAEQLQEEWVSEAVRMFGEDLVKIKED